jgi:hypothetical protein
MLDETRSRLLPALGGLLLWGIGDAMHETFLRQYRELRDYFLVWQLQNDYGCVRREEASSYQ